MVANNKTRIAFAATILSMATTLPGVLSLSPALHQSFSRASGRSTSSRVSMSLKGKHKLVLEISKWNHPDFFSELGNIGMPI